MSSHKSSLASAEGPRYAARRTTTMPVPLQPEAILEAAATTVAVDVNATSTPQRLNAPMSFTDFAAAYSKKIDGAGSDSSAASEAAAPFVSPSLSSYAAKPNGRLQRRPQFPGRGTSPSSSFPASPAVISGGGGAAAAAAAKALVEAQKDQNSNLFIRNLDLAVEQAELDRLFSAYGSILSSAVMRNIHTGESLGTAFVRLSTHDEARAAIEAMQGCTIRSRPITIQWARRHDGAPVGEARKKITKLFVRNVPLDCSPDMLEALFSAYGVVRQVTLHKDTAHVEDPAMERLIAFVIYAEEGAAERAATAVHNTKPFAACYGIPIMVKLAEDTVRHDRARNGNNSYSSNSQQHHNPNHSYHGNASGEHTPLPTQQSGLSACNSGRGARSLTSPSATPALDAHPVRPLARGVGVAHGFEVSCPQERLTTPPHCNIRAGRDGSSPTPRPAIFSPLSATVPFCTSVPMNDANLLYEPGVNYQLGDCQKRATAEAATAASSFAAARSQMPQILVSPVQPDALRASLESSLDSGSRSGFTIPNPRSLATRAAAIVTPAPMHGAPTTAAAAAATRGGVAARLVSPGQSLRSPPGEMRSFSVRGEQGEEVLRSPTMYRHHPYSLVCSALVY